MNRTSKNIYRREAEIKTKMLEVRHGIIRKSFSELQNKMATVRSQISEFEIEEFFRSLEALLSNLLHNNISFDMAAFLYRRFDGYERNISVLLARLRESFPAEEQLLEDLGNLLEIVRHQRECCETLSFHLFLAEDQETNGQVLTSVTVNRNGVGRPTLDVSQQLLEILHFQVGFCWSQIARNLGISESTLRHRRHSFQIPNSPQSFSNISDNVLDQIVCEILHVTPRIGYRLVQGALHQRGLHIQQRCVLEALQRVDPVMVTLRGSRSIIRRRYSVACPNALWYVTENERMWLSNLPTILSNIQSTYL